MIERILIGYDGSDEARDALSLGAALAARLSATPVLATCIEGASGQGKDPTDVAEALFDDAVAHAPALAGESVGRLTKVGVSGAAGLLDLASAEDIDLIAIGSTHRGPVGRVLPGSTALRLVSDGRFPVAIATRGLAGEAIASGEVAIAYDGSEEASNALRFAISLASQTDAPVRVLSALGSQAEESAPALLDRVGDSGAGDAAEQRDILRRRVERALEYLPAGLGVERVFVEGSPTRAIPNYEMAPSALLVTGSHGRGPLRSLIFGSVSDALADASPWPLIVVPPGADHADEHGAADTRDPSA